MLSGFPLVLLLIGAQSASAQLFNNLFCMGDSRETGCLLGFLGYTMHQMDGDQQCVESCALFPFFKRNWECGGCEDEVVLPQSPVVAPSTVPPTQAPVPPRPVSNAPATMAPVFMAVQPTIAPISPTPVQAPVTQAPVPAPVQAPITQFPVPAPVQAPITQVPVPAPVSNTKAPISSAPVPAPVQAPISLAPVFPTANLPVGPYISNSENSERITLPNPAEADISGTKINCPHDEAGLLDWHSSATWPSGGVPAEDQDVTLPLASKVVIRRSVSEKLGIVTIPVSSSLIIAEDSSGVALSAHGMNVLGSLVAGSENCRLTESITITLTGVRPADAVTNPKEHTYKGISVSGTISLHGKRYFRTWTRLSKSVVPGDEVLLLQDTVNWEPGQEIVVVTTAMKDSREWHRNHVNIVAGLVTNPVTGVGSAVYLKNPVPYAYIANAGYQGEVGLLTRTIKIQGSGDSEPTDNLPIVDCTVEPKSSLARFGDQNVPCQNHLTGFGGHVIVHDGGRGYVEGVELYRMGQTNVLGRYPIHFHLLGDCPECYLRDSSVHRSFYRCISIHGTNQATVTENVAYDVTGYCYYLEDGVEEDNTLSYNLAAHIHTIGGPPKTYSQTTDTFKSSSDLTLPADITASGFYITNVHNNLIGNAASGGWSGFAFPNLPTGLQSFRNEIFRPSSVTSLTIDGNSAHSTGWWWDHGGAFYFGGSLYYENDILTYNPGRSFNFDDHNRRPCEVNACALSPRFDCVYGCPEDKRTSVAMTNSKAFLVAGVGLNSWSGSMEIAGFETHDTGLAMESLSDGFWIDDLLAVCRTGEALIKPTAPEEWEQMMGNGFVWYDTGQEHIITDSTFRNCGYRSAEFNQYDTAADRGCGVASDSQAGCREESTVFGFLTHSDQFTPEVMQGTRNITFDNCGRRFSLDTYPKDYESVSRRSQNWLDADGSVSGLGVPTLIGSGHEKASTWWTVDDAVVFEPQGPLQFIEATPMTNAPERGLGHVKAQWDDSEHSKVGTDICGNGSWDNLLCPTLGTVRHAGKRFSGSPGLPVTASGDLVGPVGGFGWIMAFAAGAPRAMKFLDIEVLPETPLLVSIAYPIGTDFNITFTAPEWCYNASSIYTCTEIFTVAASLEQVRTGPGNQYYVDASGVLTFRISQPPESYAGPRDEWSIPQRTDLNLNGPGLALGRFERDGVYLPKQGYGTFMTIDADCQGTGPYCAGGTASYDPDVCSAGYEQHGYDYCCSTTDITDCVFASNS